MARYRNQSVVIDAFQWTGGPDQEEDPAWICDALRSGKARLENASTPSVVMLLDTAAGVERVAQGDWIARSAIGELYACKASIFAATYEPA